jgi:hypothetical protein
MNSAQTWRLRTVAEAADMIPRALRQCFEIKALKLSGADRKPTGSGTCVGLSRPRAYQAAIMKHLNKLGLSIPDAARSAFEFSDVGNIGRAPGCEFDHGKTVLVVCSDSTTVKNIFSGTSLTDISTGSPCAIIVDVNAVVAQVNEVLNKVS